MSPMSSTVSVTPLALEIRPSRLLALYVLCVHAIAMLVVFVLPISLWLKCGLLFVLTMSCALTYRRRVGLRSRHSIMGLNRSTDGIWRIQLGDGTVHEVVLLPDSYLHPELLILNFRVGKRRRRSVVLLRDSADCTCLRHLRVALAMGARESVVR
jgi:toxin CptA